MKNTLKLIILLMFLAGMIFLIFGHIDYYNEQVIDEIKDEYLGHAEISRDKDGVEIAFFDDSDIVFTVPEEMIGGIDLEKITKNEQPMMHIYADLVLINAHSEKRTIITGRLKEDSVDMQFYRIVRVKCVPLYESNITFTQNVDHSLIKWQEDRNR